MPKEMRKIPLRTELDKVAAVESSYRPQGGYMWWLCRFLAVLAATVTIAPLPAQHVHPSTSLPVLIDGAKEPNRIPFELALKHYLVAAAEPYPTHAEGTARVDAKIAPLRLSPEDRLILVKELGVLRQALDDAEQSVTAAGPERRQQAAAQARLRRDTALGGTIAQIRNLLSAAGQRNLEQHIREQVTPRIVVYGTK